MHRPTRVLFCLHFLGGSAREWDEVARDLSGLHGIALDLPGFGDAAETPGYSVAEMAAHVATAIRAHDPAPGWMLAGHSMGAKVAAVLARRAEDGAPELAGLAGIVLVAGSPPGPEPMDASQRETMLGWFSGDEDARRSDAREYIALNSNGLDAERFEAAVDGVLRANRAAWIAWLAAGSREDWSGRVGIVHVPALVIAGEEDEALGPEAQRERMAPHFADVRIRTVPAAKHLLPLERPDRIAALISEFAASLGGDDARDVAIPAAAYRRLIDSGRVGAKTRAALLARARSDEADFEPAVIEAASLPALRALLDCVIPQTHEPRLDLAARIDAVLASGTGDGWRFAELPPDGEAYRRGLRTVRAESLRRYGRDFTELDAEGRDGALAEMAAGTFGSEADDGLPPSSMKLWFEDVRGDAVKAYVAHPATLARMGYSGIANGGDGSPKSGFARVGPGEREAWEPQAGSEVTK